MGGALWVWSVGCVWNIMSQVVVIIHSKVCVCMLYADHYPVLVLYTPTTLSCCIYLFLHRGLTMSDGEEVGDLSGASTSQLSTALTAMLQTMAQSQQQLQEDLLSLKTQLLSGQEDTAERVAKRLRREKAFDFKRKGYKRQFEFNELVVDKIEEATSAVGSCTAASSSGKDTTPTLQSGKDVLEKGLQLLFPAPEVN